MELVEALTFLRENLLPILAVVLTLVFVYHYIIEKEHGIKLSKKYRDSIFEAQSRIFLNATQYLISGHKDLAIKEFQNAVDLNRETLDTYFALGGLFRSNGEIDKAISIHRALIARENISESTRLRALKELAIDFDKGGFLDKAIETYKDVLKINRDQDEVIKALCRIYEDIGDWDQAYNYRIMLSKVGQDNQSETISHILVEKCKLHFENDDFSAAAEDLDDAFRFAPSVSAKILKLKLYLIQGKVEDANMMLIELLKEHPMYTSFIFVSLDDEQLAHNEIYKKNFTRLKTFFLNLKDTDLQDSASVILSQIRLLKGEERKDEAFKLLNKWLEENNTSSDVLKIEHIKLLIDTGQDKLALEQTREVLGSLHSTLTRHYCSQCGFNSDEIFWRCPQCHKWETIQFRWKV